MSYTGLGHYVMTVRAGPAHTDVMLDMSFYDHEGVLLGSYGESMIAFACTWKDVALSIRTGLRALHLPCEGPQNVSPMVDLS